MEAIKRNIKRLEKILETLDKTGNLQLAWHMYALKQPFSTMDACTLCNPYRKGGSCGDCPVHAVQGVKCGEKGSLSWKARQAVKRRDLATARSILAGALRLLKERVELLEDRLSR